MIFNSHCPTTAEKSDTFRTDKQRENENKTVQNKLKKARNRKTPDWNMKEIQLMKNKKCRDALGLIYELLKPGIARRDFKLSLVLLLNNT